MSRPTLKCSWSILLQSCHNLPRSLQLSLLILVSGLSNLFAQPELLNEGSRVETLPGGGRVLEWYGKTGRSYFIQVSDPADPLRKWKWSDIIERGNNQSISYEVDSTADKAFFRLQYTDQTADDLENADFDGDGITNFAEITATALALGSSYFIQSNPLDADTDHDGLGDKFERDHGLDPSDDGSNDPAYGPNGDPDGDGLTNLEEQTRGTGPNKRDTDNDGVSDWDEIFLNQSDPIATMDTDNDGIPDDFEKWLSSQLLAFRPDPAHWGAFSTGLLTGNLNPTHDYTDENLTALQLSTQLNRLNESDSQNSAFKIERQERVTRLLGYSGQGPTPISGYFDILMPNGYFGTQITAASELDSANFLARSEASNWKQSSSPVLNSWQGFNQNYLTSYGESFFSTTTHGGNTQYSARLVQSRFQIQATRLDHEPITQQLLKVVTRAPIINNNGNIVNLEIVSVDKLSVNIPQGKFFSSWHEFQPPVTDGYFTMIDLLPVEIMSDLNNDGQITAADNPLRDAAAASGATDEIKDKGTEFIFHNDTLSNGIWDKEDTDPAKPATAKDDDDAEEIRVKPGITEGEVWLEHPAIAGLSFYKTRECKAADKVNLSPNSKFTVSASNPFPDTLYMRADVDLTYPEANPQFEGDLVLKIKVGTAGQEIEALKMKLTVVKQLGAKKYFHAAKDYILERNTRFHIKDAEYEDDRFGWGDSHFRMVSMRESATTLFPIDASRRTGGAQLKGIDSTATAFPGISVAINGNISYFSDDNYNSTVSRILIPGSENSITDKCHGRMVRFSAFDAAVSSDNAVVTTSPAGSPFAGPEGKFISVKQDNKFALGKGQVPLNPVPKSALGGNSVNYNDQLRDGKPYQIFGRCEVEHQTEDNVIVFTATHLQPPGNGFLGKMSEFVEDAKRSGVKALPGGDPGDVEVLLLDGGSSVGLGYTNPDDTMTIQIKGGKHTGQLPFYYINTYLLFKCEKPR